MDQPTSLTVAVVGATGVVGRTMVQVLGERGFPVGELRKTEVRRNSEWFGRMSAADMVRLAGRGTVARLIERDDFTKRMT